MLFKLLAIVVKENQRCVLNKNTDYNQRNFLKDLNIT